MEEVVITGIGALLPNCDTASTLWSQLRNGESQLKFGVNPDERSGARIPIGRIEGFEARRYLAELPEKLYGRYTRDQQLYLSSVLLARTDAGMDLASIPRERIGLFDGTSRGGLAFWYDRVRGEQLDPSSPAFTKRELSIGMPGMSVGFAAALLGIEGPTYTFASSCASGAVALGHALRSLQQGEIDVAFGTGHDAALLPPVYRMYGDAGLLSDEQKDARCAIRPYGGDSRNAFGEGAVTMVLERRSHAERRGARIYASLAGFCFGNGGQHPTDVDATGSRPARVLLSLLERGGLSPRDVQFVIGHGNGVPMSDASELAYMQLVFGGRTAEVPLVSTKPIYGHTLGASSALSAAAAALVLHHGYIIPTINIDEAKVATGHCHQANRGRSAAVQAGLVVAFGIGGQNAALLLRRTPAAHEAAA